MVLSGHQYETVANYIAKPGQNWPSIPPGLTDLTGNRPGSWSRSFPSAAGLIARTSPHALNDGGGLQPQVPVLIGNDAKV